jgi:large subunit ribosomal protein L6
MSSGIEGGRMSAVATSRIGRKPIDVPNGVQVTITTDGLVVKGPKGTLSMPLSQYVSVAYNDNQLTVSPCVEGAVITGKSKKLSKSIVGTTRATASNIIKGVSDGLQKKLLLVGVGYRAQVKGTSLSLSLGFSHPADFEIPEGITIETPTQTEIIIKGMDAQKVGQVAAKIRSLRPPEPYKGKGVRYSDEVVEIKETKKK